MLALAGASTAFFLAGREPSARVAPPPPAHAFDRSYAVMEGIAEGDQPSVWNVMSMAGITEECGGARAWSVAEQRDDRTQASRGFIIFCERSGFFVIEADRESGSLGSVGPVSKLEMAEHVIDKDAFFAWAGRRPTLRVKR